MKTIKKPQLVKLFDKLNYNLIHNSRGSAPDHTFFNINRLLSAPKENYIDLFREYFTFNNLLEIEHIISSIDHIGIIVPNYFDINSLEQKSVDYGFNSESKIFPSMVISKLLGELLDRNEIPTMIFKSYNSAHQAIEMFLAELNGEVVEELIRNRYGNHIGIRLKDYESLQILQEIMNDSHIKMPAFMQSKPIVNPYEKSTVFYYELDASYGTILEFIYIDKETAA